MKSCVWWIGGKSSVADKIVTMFPKHRVYCEVFFGGGSIFFAKNPSEIEILNDIHEELINFYQILRSNITDFKKRADLDLYSRTLYDRYVKSIEDGTYYELDNVEKAYRFFYITRTSWNGIFGSGLSTSTHANRSSCFWDLVNNLDEHSKRLKNCTIENLDFENVIKKYDKEETLFCLDPPYIVPGEKIDTYYFSVFTKMKNMGFSLADQQRLYKTLLGINGKFLMTIDDCKFIRDRYTSDKFWITDNTFYYASADKKVNELIITNYDPNNVKKFGKQKTMI